MEQAAAEIVSIIEGSKWPRIVEKNVVSGGVCSSSVARVCSFINILIFTTGSTDNLMYRRRDLGQGAAVAKCTASFGEKLLR